MKYGSLRGSKTVTMPKKAGKTAANGKDLGTPPMKYAKDANVVQSKAKTFA